MLFLFLCLFLKKRLDPQLVASDETDEQSLAWNVLKGILLEPNSDILKVPKEFDILTPHQIIHLCHTALSILKKEPTMLKIDPPVKIFGDIHGQVYLLFYFLFFFVFLGF